MQPQYSGTAGKIANCQIGVFLAYASPKEPAFIDRELYLPRSWTQDKRRRQEAGVPERVEYQSKTDLALRMLERAFAEGISVKWVTADALYGSDSAVRRWLEQRHQSYVVAVRSNVYLWETEETFQQITAAEWEADWVPRRGSG